MKVNWDNQTINDLGIIENRYEEKEIFSLFNATHSYGGKKILRKWITKPLNDLSILTKRIEALKSNTFFHLSIRNEELDFIEHYLNYEDKPTVYSRFNSFFMLLFRSSHHKSSRYVIERGIKLVTELLEELELACQKITSDSPTLFQDFAQQIKNTLHFTELKELVPFRKNAKLNYYTIDYYDYLFRYKCHISLSNLLDIVYQIDAIHTIHRTAEKKGFSYPQLSSEKGFYLKDIYHPLIDKPVKNDWEIYQSHICIFTGSNMAGKSTFLKAVGIAVWLAHCGLPVPASYMKCPIFDGIYTSINLPDSIKDGRSHFYSEVLRIKEILQKIKEGKKCFVILDEMFRGTNAQDAFDASCAVNKILNNEDESVFLISTHILEFANHFVNSPTCSFYYMESEIKNNQLMCSYKLKSGISETRVGYWIVKNELEQI